MAEVRVGVLGGLSLGPFMLWECAVGAADALNDVLAQLHLPADLSIPRPPVPLHTAVVSWTSDHVDVFLDGAEWSPQQSEVLISVKNPDAPGWFRLKYEPPRR